MSVDEAVATRILMRVIRVAAAWLKRWRRGGEGGRRRCRAEVEKVRDGVTPFRAEAETMAARQGGADGGLNGGGGRGEVVSAGSNGRVGGTANNGSGGVVQWTHAHAGGGCTRAGPRMAAGGETSAVAGAHVAGSSELVQEARGTAALARAVSAAEWRTAAAVKPRSRAEPRSRVVPRSRAEPRSATEHTAAAPVETAVAVKEMGCRPKYGHVPYSPKEDVDRAD